MIQMLTLYLSDRLLVGVLVAFGLVATLSTRFMQWRLFGEMFRSLRGSFRRGSATLSSYQALNISLAGRVGSGNIAGVSVALVLGGPGALFWMWVAGLLGMATSFFECALAQLYKVRDPTGAFRGGPAFYIENGLGRRQLAIAFSVLLLVHAGLMMSAFQSYTVSASLHEAFGIGSVTSGLAMVAALAIVIIGGVRRIASAADVLVPFMVIGYMLAAIAVIVVNAAELPALLGQVFSHAFGMEAAVGGGVGAAIVNGTKRALFANEAGLGTAPNVAAVADVRHPAAQGLVQSLSVFIDTFVVCTSTAAIVLFSDAYATGSIANGTVLTQIALAEQLGAWGRPFISLALVLFAFTSLLYSYYLAENCLAHLGFSTRGALTLFRIVAIGVAFWGSQQDLSTIFAMADLVMVGIGGLNLYCLYRLAPVARRLLTDYQSQRKNGINEPSLDADRFADQKLDRDAWR